MTPHFAHFYINNPNSGLKTVNLKLLSQYDGKCVKMGPKKLDFWHFYPKICHVTRHFSGFYTNFPNSGLKIVKFKPMSLYDGKMCKTGQKLNFSYFCPKTCHVFGQKNDSLLGIPVSNFRMYLTASVKHQKQLHHRICIAL